MDPQKGVIGLKAGPRRTAFGDVSNTVKNIITENAKNATGVIPVNEKQIPQKTTGAISKPALRANIKTASSTTTQPLNVSNAVNSRKDARRPAVYQDKRPSPKRPSPKRASPPKVSRDAIAKKESQYTQASNQAGKSRFSKAFSRPLSSLVHSKQVSSKEEVPVYSDQHPHLYSGGYIDEEDEEDNGVEIEDDDDVSGDEEERLEGDKIRVGASTEVISDYESDEGEDDESEYTATRGDNTTGVTLALPLVPRWTLQAKKELQIVQKEFDYYDEEDEGDISMVAEYSEEIFEYMRELEVSSATSCNVFVSGRSHGLLYRSNCCPMRATWTISLRFSGPCVPFSWTGSSKSILVSICSLRPCSFARTMSIASSHLKSFPLVNCNSSVLLRYLLLRNTKRSTVLPSTRLCIWSIMATQPRKS